MSEVQWRAAPQEMERAVDEALGLQAISIRLPIALIEQYKALAEARGVRYQPLMRQALAAFMESNDANVSPQGNALPAP